MRDTNDDQNNKNKHSLLESGLFPLEDSEISGRTRSGHDDLFSDQKSEIVGEDCAHVYKERKQR